VAVQHRDRRRSRLTGRLQPRAHDRPGLWLWLSCAALRMSRTRLMSVTPIRSGPKQSLDLLGRVRPRLVGFTVLRLADGEASLIVSFSTICDIYEIENSMAQLLEQFTDRVESYRSRLCFLFAVPGYRWLVLSQAEPRVREVATRAES
jgi:hypothetical protein